MEAEIMSTHNVPTGDIIPQSTSMEKASTLTPMLAHISLESGLSPPLLNIAPTHSGMPEEMEENQQNGEEQHEEEDQNVALLNLSEINKNFRWQMITFMAETDQIYF